MRIESVRISGFRCFGATPTKVSLGSSVTAIIGPNAAGKTAVLQALTKLFGVSRAQRTIHRSDFQVGPRDNPEDRNSKMLFIEVVIGFPELGKGARLPRQSRRPSGRCRSADRVLRQSVG